jgi:hypothetical protein
MSKGVHPTERVQNRSHFEQASVRRSPSHSIATEAVANGDYSRLTPEVIARADDLDRNGAVCSTTGDTQHRASKRPGRGSRRYQHAEIVASSTDAA